MRRRDFLDAVGRVGGASALYGTMFALGLLPSPADAQTTAGKPFLLDGEPGRGAKIVILGGGLAGLCAAYELGRKGYDCTVIEAQSRPGGRCHTIRRGTVIEEIGGARQVCQFDEGEYLNPGPARIPQHHVTLDYCRDFGVAIQPFAQVNEAAYYHAEGDRFGAVSGKRIRQHEAKADLYGYTAELLCKALSQSALDMPLTAEDKERLIAFLSVDGQLRDDHTYHGGDRSGYTSWPGAAENGGVPRSPLSLHELLQCGVGFAFSDDYESNWQPMLFQIVGGMDNLARAFAKRLGKRVTYNARIVALRQNDTGVSVVYQDEKKRTHTVSGDYAVCALPLNQLQKINADLAPEIKRGLPAVSYAATVKVGLQFKRRFWEEDDRIFGGITRTSLPITHIFYPSYGFLGRRGVLMACYNFGPDADAAGRLSPPERLQWAIKNGAKIHPQYAAEFENGVSFPWQNIPFQEGAWAEWQGDSRATLYPRLCKGDGRIYFAGEHLSNLGGWQAGALESARYVVRQIHVRAQQERTSGNGKERKAT